NKMQNILFRADSSSAIGLGHIMRDLVLASQFKDSNIFFATQDLQGNINHRILENNYKLEILKSNSKKELVKLIKKLNINLLVIDHYGIDYKIEKYIKEKTGVKILAFDDTYEKHFCDTLLNHNLGADSSRYKNLVPKNCELRCGSRYTLLRDEFHKQKHKIQKSKKTKTKTIFVAIGGTDHTNINRKILKVLSKIQNIKVALITSSSNKNLKKLKIYIKDKEWIKLHIDSSKIAKLMGKSDFAIITPSVIANETYFMELPSITIKTTSNQKNIYEYLKKNGYATLKKFNKQRLKKEIGKFL
ncbi:MAG: UDP-2,4-diacetamido-2,4,6-trideoxy-beta-L-altropyranose hydrolase, partial [Campylobacterota bacterium]|nr:UDP-2,4-diacetamido-2,4,6-trideoxy-beta-L-altropyranose hydrolase [Campylobacterota bacterium]